MSHIADLAFKYEAQNPLLYKPKPSDVNNLEIVGFGDVTNPKKLKKLKKLWDKGKIKKVKKLAKDFLVAKGRDWPKHTNNHQLKQVIIGLAHHRGPKKGIREILERFTGTSGESDQKLVESVDKVLSSLPDTQIVQKWKNAREDQEYKDHVPRIWNKKSAKEKAEESLDEFIERRKNDFHAGLYNRWSDEARVLTS